MPSLVDHNSVQVSGRGNAVIRDVRFGQQQMTVLTDKQLQALTDQRDSLKDSTRIIDDQIGTLQNQKEFIDNIAKKVTSSESEKGSGTDLDPTKWSAMLGFYRKSLDQLNVEIRSAESNKKNIASRIDKLNREIEDRDADRSKTKPFVDVVVEVKEAGPIEIELSYVVHGVSWTPAYTLRVISDAKTINVMYNAMIRQYTGEDWKDVSLNLSTATPAIGGAIPTLQPWYVNESTPQKKSFGIERLVSQQGDQIRSLMMQKRGETKEREMATLSKSFEPPMTVKNSSVDKNIYSAVFLLSGVKDIASDKQEHQVTIATFELPSEFAYVSIPKLQPKAFLNAKVSNKTDYTLLPGSTSVFLDNTFVSKGNMELVAPGQSFETSLGVDDQIHVERKLINRFEKDEGLIAKRKEFIFSYAITLKNNKQIDDSLIVMDQVPVSSNQNIIVTYLPPEKSQIQEPTIDKTGIVEWQLQVKAHQEIIIPFSFSVESPRDVKVDGI